MTKLPVGFEPQVLSVDVDCVLPSRRVPVAITISKKYQQIIASIRDVGLIEPLSVRPTNGQAGKYFLLDGHLRLIALTKLNYKTIPCLIATDDESYTYNNRINKLSTIQEHFMIRSVMERGVTSERLAKAFNVDTRTIIRKAGLLRGICSEAAELLKDREFSLDVSRALRKMKPMRQVECVDLMVSANIVTVAYAEAMLVATPAGLLVDDKKPQKLAGLSQEQIAKMEQEMSNLQKQYKLVEQNYGQDVLNLVLAKGYLSKLLENPAVVHFLREEQPEILDEFDTIVKTVSLDQ